VLQTKFITEKTDKANHAHNNPMFAINNAERRKNRRLSSDALSCSPPRIGYEAAAHPTDARSASPFECEASTSSTEALSRQRELDNVSGTFKVFAVTQWYSDHRQPRIIATSIALNAGALVALLGMPSNSLFAEIAVACPPNSCREVCVEQAELLKTKVDQLMRELSETKHRIVSQHALDTNSEPLSDEELASYSPDNNQSQGTLVYIVRMQAIHDTMKSLRRLSELVLCAQQRTESSKNWVMAVKRLQCRQFYANFQLVDYGRTSTVKVSEPCMLLCDSKIGTDSVWLDCCKQNVHVCKICLFKHAYESSKNGIKSFFECSHCRAVLPLYQHLDKGAAAMTVDHSR